MRNSRRKLLLIGLFLASMLIFAACQAPEAEIIEVTRVVTETETITEQIEVTRIVEGETITEQIEVTRIVEVEVEPEPEAMAEEPPEVVLQWSGGTFYEAVNENWVETFEEETGIDVNYLEGSVLPPILKAMVESGNVTVDLAGMDPWVGGKLGALGLIQEINYDLFDPEVLEQIPERWRSGSIFKYGIPGHVACRVIAWNTDVFGDDPPQDWVDFWDVEKYPGPRAMWWGGYGDPEIEPALFAAGYTAAEMETITPQMLDEAYAKLDEIKPNVVKWTTGGAETAELLSRGDAVLGTPFDGRAQAVIDEGAPVAFTRNQMRCAPGFLAIPTGAPHPVNAHKLLNHILKAESQALFQEDFAYGGINPFAADFLAPDRAAILSTGFADLAVYPSNEFYNAPIDPNDIFGQSFSLWLADNWPEFEAASPGDYIPSEHLPALE